MQSVGGYITSPSMVTVREVGDDSKKVVDKVHRRTPDSRLEERKGRK